MIGLLFTFSFWDKYDWFFFFFFFLMESGGIIDRNQCLYYISYCALVTKSSLPQGS